MRFQAECDLGLAHVKTRSEGVSGRVGTGVGVARFGGTAIRYLIMGGAAVDSPARSHQRIVDNAHKTLPAR